MRKRNYLNWKGKNRENLAQILGNWGNTPDQDSVKQQGTKTCFNCHRPGYIVKDCKAGDKEKVGAKEKAAHHIVPQHLQYPVPKVPMVPYSTHGTHSTYSTHSTDSTLSSYNS